MQFFRNLSITQKITFISMITSTAALFLASVAFLSYEVSRERESTSDHIKTIAEMIAVNTTAALSFDDVGSATETLSSLAVEHSVITGCVYDASGDLFASYYRDPRSAKCAVSAADTPSVGNPTDGSSFAVPVSREGQVLGTILVQSYPVNIWQRVGGYASITGLVALASVIFAFLVAVVLRRFISTPILRLTKAAHAVTATKDYSLRVAGGSPDEIGTLVEAFNVMLDQIHERDRELESFAYSISHDLRAPLRGMQGLAYLILEDYGDTLDESARGYLARIQAGAIRMDDLIDGILRLSRSVRIEIRTERIDLSEMAEQVIADLDTNKGDKSSQIVIAQGVVTYADRQLIRIVIDNLLSNAWKFTAQETHRRIEVGTYEGHEGRVFFVKDNGVGFDMEHASKLFQPFHRLHHPEQFEGTGIGLATVARIIGRHGGRIWAKADTNKGATFFFTL